MKRKILSLFLTLVMLAVSLPIAAAAQTESSVDLPCESCSMAGDMDQNGDVDLDDAIYLLYSSLFPEYYPLPEHTDHSETDCAECLKIGDVDQNGVLDIDDAIYLLYHVSFPESYHLPECPELYLLSVGYARADITPEDSMEIYGSMATKAHDPLQITCTAVSDGESTALLFSLDLRNLSQDFSDSMMNLVERKFKIPGSHMFFNITHTHSTPTVGAGGTAGTKWRNKILSQLEVVVREALADMDPVKGAYVGTGYTDGITFVRRYLLKDGTYQTNPSKNVVAHESVADNQMRTIRLDRLNKKDVLMVNYQTHYGSATGLYKGQYSADFVHVFREEAEKKWDCHFVYHSGASGNLNFMSAISGERKYPTFVEATKEGFIPTVEGCLKGEKEVAVGKLRYASSLYEAPIYQDTEEDKAKAAIVNACGYPTDSAEYKAIAQQYGFSGYRQVQGIVTRSKLGKSINVPFYAISFGEIGFVAAPYEMFDTNGVQVRKGSPFEMTFVCSYTNGGYGYVPSSLAFPHGGYEVLVSRFCRTTGDDFANEMIRLLKQCKKQG